MAERDVRERDILVASNEYAYVQDLTKGDIVLYVGPTKISLSNTERLVEYRGDRFVPVRGEDGGIGVAPFISASSAQYLVLENPAKDPASKPVKGNNSAIELLNGRKIVVPGPASFPLWPGQKAKVVDGHSLAEDQYLRVRVYEPTAGDARPIGTEWIVKGSDVSFYVPPTGVEVIQDEKGRYVRAAVKLRRDMGLHLRVTQDFTAEEHDQLPPGGYSAGQELFLSEREGFFFPTENLDVVGEVRAVPIAEKEGVYVRDLMTGKISTIVGPRSFLPDPTQMQLVSRKLEAEIAALYGVPQRPDPTRAVSIYIPPSYAVLVTARSRREVVRGPQTRILDYDEELEVLHLSTGRPKSDEALLPTCFLLTEGNRVSDIVRVRTRDHVELNVSLSYRVSFITRGSELDNARWFNVNDYVALLCDHAGSIVRAAVRAIGIDAFHSASAEIIRSAILGEKHGEERRVGRTFEENGLSVYDVEVLDVTILDAQVKELLQGAQRGAIIAEVTRKQEELRLSGERLKESVEREIFAARGQTIEQELLLEVQERKLAIARATGASEVARLEKLGEATSEAEALAVASVAKTAAAERDAAVDERRQKAGVAAFSEQMAALQPELIATLKMLGNQHLAAELTKNVSPLAILGGESVASVAERLLQALPLGPGQTIANVLPLRPKPVAE